MNKKILKIIFVLFLIIFMLYIYEKPVLAKSYADYGIGVEDIKAGDKSSTSKKVAKTAGAAINLVRVIAVAIGVIMIVVLGLKYISSSPNEKAEIKKHAVVYVVGALILFSVSGLLGIIQRFGKLVNDEAS